jgi:hypothetical protein
MKVSYFGYNDVKVVLLHLALTLKGPRYHYTFWIRAGFRKDRLFPLPLGSRLS